MRTRPLQATPPWAISTRSLDLKATPQIVDYSGTGHSLKRSCKRCGGWTDDVEWCGLCHGANRARPKKKLSGGGHTLGAGRALRAGPRRCRRKTIPVIRARGSSDPGQSRPGSVKLAGSCKLLQYPLKAPETQCTSVAERQASPRPVLPSGRRRPPQSGWGAASRGQTGASGQSLANGWRPCVRSVAVASRAC